MDINICSKLLDILAKYIRHLTDVFTAIYVEKTLVVNQIRNLITFITTTLT